MSQARITLRPPPNVEFVQGYPGIPASAPERPHAEVKGTIELRLGAQGVKAKWVRVELRKVETLPGGGQANTFYDFVGPSPVKVWEAESGAEWSWLHTQDFPFSIRIPESVPPTITLDKGGIKYELIATLCMKGKKGFFRKSSTPTLTTMTPIIIDKHELHSTWPVYAQPESRHVADELLTLTVDRSNTCFGPGDRVKVLATFKNDGVTVASLRAFEFVLKETIIFRAGPHVSGKKGAPQVYVTPIGEQKVPVNATIYGGQQHRVELGCFIPQTHTTATVNAARHIDITYSINVKAVLSSGKPLLMEFPVTVSNWPRNMSAEAVKRIGPSPNLSLMTPAQYQAMQMQRRQPETISVTRPTAQPQTDHNQNFNTAPGRTGAFQMRPHPIQERIAQHSGSGNIMKSTSLPTNVNSPAAGATGNDYDEFGYPLVSNGAQGNGYATAQDDQTTDTRRRPPLNTNPANRLTIANMTHDPEPDTPPAETAQNRFPTAEEEKQRLRNAYNSTGASGSSSNAQTNRSIPAPAPASQPQASIPAVPSISSRSHWPTAEEEKQRLFENARQQALKTQAQMGNLVSSTQSQSYRESEPPDEEPATKPKSVPSPVSASAPKRSTPWPTAEEEKMRLYSQAREAAAKSQAEVLGESANVLRKSPPPINQYPEGSNGVKVAKAGSSGQRRPMETKSAGAQLYQHAVASMNRNSTAPEPAPKAASPPASPPAPKPRESPPASRTRFPTAEEEKAAFRYYEAKRAVERHQQMDRYSPPSVPVEDPIAYDALYPGTSASQTILPGPSQPSNFASGSSSSPRHDPQSYGQAATSRHRSNSSLNSVNGGSFLPSVTPPDSPPLPPPPASSSAYNSVLAEKERLRQRYAAEDATVAAASGPAPSPPPRGMSMDGPPGYGSPPASRAQPLPPVDGSGWRPLTAAEEKARLKAQYEAEEVAAASSSGAGPSTSPSYSPPALSSPLPSSFSRSPSLSYGDSSYSDMGRKSSVAYGKRASIAPVLAEHDESQEEFVPPPLPPPLAPKPPAEYIQETQEEDARMRAEDHALAPSIEATLSRENTLHKSQLQPENPRVDFGLSFRPFSPLNLDINFDNSDRSGRPTPSSTPGPSLAPPLPPKVLVLD